MIRLELPQHLRTLAHIQGEVMLEVPEPVTLRSVLDTLEACYPMLRGTIRDHVTNAPPVRPVLCVPGRPVSPIAGFTFAGCCGQGR
jgi:hypothetical protein